MKTLFMVRHGHAAGGNALVTDARRELTPRGAAEARLVADHLGELQPAPVIILSSAAERARGTAEILRAGAEDADLRLEAELYGADPATWIQHLQALGDQVAAVLLVGHNPGLELLATELTGARVGFLPATLAHIQLQITSWQDLVADGTGRLIQIWTPDA